MKMSLTINGEQHAVEISGPETLLDFLRDRGYFGVKRGCDNGDCGACAVLVDGRAVCSCIMLAGQAHGRTITTIEGLGDPLTPHPLQKTFVDLGAAQCGFCIPGMIVSAKELLDTHPHPTQDQMARYLDGVLCRCTGYTKQFEAIEEAAALIRHAGSTGARTTPALPGPSTPGADHRTGPPRSAARASDKARTKAASRSAPKTRAKAKAKAKAKATPKATPKARSKAKAPVRHGVPHKVGRKARTTFPARRPPTAKPRVKTTPAKTRGTPAKTRGRPSRSTARGRSKR